MKTLTKQNAKVVKGMTVNLKPVTMPTKQIFKTGEVGKTKNYSLFTPLALNRGKDTSIDPKRLEHRMRKIQSGNFHRRFCVLVNQFGIMLDGNHTFEAFKRLGMPICYEVHPSELANTTDKKVLLKIVSEINAVDSRWSRSEMFKAAFAANFPLAKTLQSEMVTINNAVKTFDKKKSVKPTWVYALLDKQADLFLRGQVLNSMDTYDNTNLVNAARTNEYKENRQHYIDLCGILIGQNIQRFSRIAGTVLGLYWDGLLDINRFKKQLKANPFPSTVKDSNENDVLKAIQKIQKSK